MLHVHLEHVTVLVERETRVVDEDVRAAAAAAAGPGKTVAVVGDGAVGLRGVLAA
ncbi:MAG TPA: hypothetical protein VIR34_07935 [Gemmatimonadaceae bacterium]